MYENYNHTQVNIPGYEVCYFRNICNLLIPYPKDDLDYIPIHKGNYYIPETDIVIYTTLRGENNLCPIPYKVDPINNKITIDKKYKQYKLYYGSKNQFIYKRLPLLGFTQEIPLPYDFRTGYNENNYFVFLNGRLLNKALYKIIIPTMETNKIKDKVLYFTNILDKNDVVDLFYISNGNYSRINGIGDLVVKAFSVIATEPIQRDFIIPLPYKNYPIDVEGYNSFLVFKHTLQVPTSKYKILKNKNDEYYIQLLDVDEYLNYGDKLTFIFPYYKSEEETEDALSKTNALKFVTVYKVLDSDSKTVVFNSSEIGNVKDKAAIYVFKNSELVDPSEYTVTSSNTIEFKNTVLANTQISMVIESDKNNINANSLFLDYFNIPIMTDGQWSINLPKIDSPKSYLFFRKSKLIPKTNYKISDGKLILGRDYNDLKAGEVITAVYTTDGSDSSNSVNFYEYNSIVDNTGSATIKNDIGIHYTKSNTFVFVNDVYIPNNYYTIIGNTFSFNTDKVVENDNVTVYLIYKTVNQSRISTDLTLDSNLYVRFIERTIKSTKDNQTSFDIPYLGSQVGKPKKDIPFLVFIRGIFIPESQYTISNDKIQFNSDTYVSIRKFDEINFEFCYENEFNVISKKELTASFSFSVGEEKRVYYTFVEDPKIHYDLTKKKDITDITAVTYTVDGKNNVLNGIKEIAIDSNEVLNNKETWYTVEGDTTAVLNKALNIKLNSTSIDSPIVYSQPIDLGDRIMVFYSGVYMDPSRYTIDKYNRQIVFNEEDVETDYKNKKVNIVCLYSGSSSSESIGYVPKSGYLTFDETKMDRNLNNELMMVFVNGMLVPKSKLYDLTNSLKKITRDIKSRYDLNIIKCSPVISELEPLYNPDIGLKYSVVINQTPNQRIYVTCNGKTYNSSFIALANSKISVTIKADKGYKAGNISINGNKVSSYTLDKETTITASAATKLATGKVNITNPYNNQIIQVTSNGKEYTESFEDTVGSKISVKAICSREGYTPGELNITSGTISNTPINITITAPTANKIKFEILNKNLKHQKVYVTINNNNKVLKSRAQAPIKYTDIPYGSKFLLEIIPNDGYISDDHVGPFISGKWYTVDYAYPLDNLIANETKEATKKTIKVLAVDNETITVYIWSKYGSKKDAYVVKGNDKTINVYEGYYYEAEVKSNNYGYTAGELIVYNGDRTGIVKNNITITAEPVIKELSSVIVTREDNTSDYYSIKVITSDNYSPLSEGIYKMQSGITYYAEVSLHNEVIYTSSDEIVQNGTNTITLLQDGTVDITVEENE